MNYSREDILNFAGLFFSGYLRDWHIDEHKLLDIPNMDDRRVLIMHCSCQLSFLSDNPKFPAKVLELDIWGKRPSQPVTLGGYVNAVIEVLEQGVEG